MSTANPTQHSKAEPRSRHKSKPKFDLPVEATPPEASAAWVYRAEELPSSPPLHQDVIPIQKPGPAPEPSERNPFLMVGEGLFLIGLGTMKLAFRAAGGLIAVPFRLAGMLIRD